MSFGGTSGTVSETDGVSVIFESVILLPFVSMESLLHPPIDSASAAKMSGSTIFNLLIVLIFLCITVNIYNENG